MPDLDGPTNPTTLLNTSFSSLSSISSSSHSTQSSSSTAAKRSQVCLGLILVAILTLCGVVTFFTLTWSDGHSRWAFESKGYSPGPITGPEKVHKDFCEHKHFVVRGTLRGLNSNLSAILDHVPQRKKFQIHYKINATIAFTTADIPHFRNIGFIALVLDQIPNRTAIIYLLCNCECGRQQIRMLHGIEGTPDELATTIAKSIKSSRIVNFFMCSNSITELAVLVDFNLSSQTIQIGHCQSQGTGCTVSYYNWFALPPEGFWDTTKSFIVARGFTPKGTIRVPRPWNLNVSMLPWCEIQEL